jgi:tRNA A-37 threonylcarbamoyl transferase component Bud32
MNGGHPPAGSGVMASPPMVTASELRDARRQPPASFRIRTEGGEELSLARLLRVLPGKRLVGEGRRGDERVLVKLFVARESRRHWERERSGIAALMGAGIPTPPLLAAGPLESGGHYLLTPYLDEATTLAGARDDGERADPMLLAAIRLVGRMHGRGLVQTDLHLGNFLRRGDELYMIDGDGIVNCLVGQDIDERAIRRNLALFLAQLPVSLEDRHAELIAAYREANPDAHFDDADLEADKVLIRDRRLGLILKKCVRDCTLFRIDRRVDRFTAVARSEADWLAPILADPDAWMARGAPLKAGNTSTVVRVELAGRAVVIKRYNIKGAGHAVSRFWRPSRAWHSWREGHRLAALGIPTPTPLALIESRLGPLRGKAWLITEYVEGPDLLEHWSRLGEAEPPQGEQQALLRTLRSLAAARISHGDMKATNLIWQDGKVMLIDLDVMKRHHNSNGFSRACLRDMTRLAENWPDESHLHEYLTAILRRLCD